MKGKASTFAEPVRRDIRCAGCGSPDWWRCRPGTDADATSFPPAFMVGVAVIPGKQIPTVAWCRACDPVFK